MVCLKTIKNQCLPPFPRKFLLSSFSFLSVFYLDEVRSHVLVAVRHTDAFPASALRRLDHNWVPNAVRRRQGLFKSSHLRFPERLLRNCAILCTTVRDGKTAAVRRGNLPKGYTGDSMTIVVLCASNVLSRSSCVVAFSGARTANNRSPQKLVKILAEYRRSR